MSHGDPSSGEKTHQAVAIRVKNRGRSVLWPPERFRRNLQTIGDKRSLKVKPITGQNCVTKDLEVLKPDTS